jgi:chorismate mutase/prephenate dehydrogenase
VTQHKPDHPPRTVADLRAAISAVDQDLLGLIARRQALARAIGEIKDDDALALRDFGREREVIEGARQAATAAGVSPDLAERVLGLLIQHSLSAQERQRVARRGTGDGRRALVIGGAGRMGGWFVRFLVSQRYEVEIADPAGSLDDLPHRADWHESPLDHDLIVVAAELRTTRDILAELAARRPRGVVFDIGSLKTPLKVPLLTLAQAGVDVTSVHPMFGPQTDLLSGRHVILVDLGRPRANRVVEDLFASTMARVVPLSLAEHDRAIAFILGLSHAVNIAFFTALAESHEDVPHLAHLSSTTFDEQLQVAGRVAEENPHLYFEIQHLNEFGGEPLAALRQAVERLETSVREGDEPSFVTLMERGREYLERRRKDGKTE